VNLFVVVWNASEPERSRAADALRSMRATFPLQDPTLHDWRSRRGYAAWLLPPADALGPRRYAHAAEHELVLFDGALVDTSRTCCAHDAAELSAHWQSLSDHLEGRFVAVRIDARAESLEVLNDPYGAYHTVVHRSGDTWWLSNSARLLARIARTATIDLEGMAQYLGLTFPGEDRSLVEGISVVPAAQRWLWNGAAGPRCATYEPVDRLASLRKRSFGTREAASLGDSLARPLEVLAEAFGPLQCPITAGRDSRILTGLMMSRGLRGDFFTAGEDGSADATIGTAIATGFDLPHRRSTKSEENVVASWEEVERRVVQQLDGTVTLMHARNSLHRADRLHSIPVQLYGGAGEVARGKHFTERFLLGTPSLAQAVRRTQVRFTRDGGLLRAEARAAVDEQVARSCRALHDRGFAPVDVPDAFDVTHEVRRWVGAQARQGCGHKDVFLPLLTRDYVRAAFATPARERYVGRIPYGLLEHLAPELNAMPFDTPWPPQSFSRLVLARIAGVPGSALRRVERRFGRRRAFEPGRKRERHFILESQVPRWREQFLDRTESSLWHVVARDRLEFLLSERATPEDRMRRFVALYQVLTAFAFQEDLERWVNDAVPATAPLVPA
jgi:asparagine synthase (glutamine-hydrolysing)